MGHVSGREEDDVDGNIPDLNERGLHFPYCLDESFIPGALSFTKFQDHILFVKVLRHVTVVRLCWAAWSLHWFWF